MIVLFRFVEDEARRWGRFLDAVLDPGLRGHYHSKRNISLKHRLAWAGIAVLFLAIPTAAQSDWSACQQPPWSQLWAISVNAGEVAWSVPFGTIPELEANGVHNSGSLNYGGIDLYRRRLGPHCGIERSTFPRYESATGKILWDTKLEVASSTGQVANRSSPSHSLLPRLFTGEPSTSRIAHMEDL
jgi:hypothetical protein